MIAIMPVRIWFLFIIVCYFNGYDIQKRLSAQAYPEFGIEGSPCLLQAEIVVKFLICEVAALQREVVTSLFHAVAEREVVGELVWA